jgi:hypothetical protein
VSLMEQELITLPEHLSSPPVCSGVRFTRSLAIYVCFVDRYLSFSTFSFDHCVVCSSFDHCVVCSSSIYGFWLPHWYRQTIYIYVEILNKFHLTKWFVEISTWQKKPGIFRHFMSLFRFLCNNFDFVCVCFSTCCFPVSRFIKF